jgi:hypothetical protein
MKPEPVPKGLRVHHGRSILFSSYVHFSAPPEVIASIIKSKGLLQVSTEDLDRERTKDVVDLVATNRNVKSEVPIPSPHK